MNSNNCLIQITLETPVNPIEGRADSEYDEALVARLTVRDDLEALMKSLDEMNRQLEMLNSKVALVETKVLL